MKTIALTLIAASIGLAQTAQKPKAQLTTNQRTPLQSRTKTAASAGPIKRRPRRTRKRRPLLRKLRRR
jgi:hypothetical protein